MERDQLESLMSLSYAEATSTTSPFLLTDNNTAGAAAQQHDQTLLNRRLANMFPQTGLAIPIPQRKEAVKIMARLIRYTVVDPDPILADKAPEASILDSGMVMLNGTDDRGFVMDLAPKIAGKLAEHNAAREGVEYEDAEGRTKTLKAIRLGQLDVVVEKVREYPG